MQLGLFSQRWRDRREHRVPAGPLIDPRDYAVDVVPERVARPFVERHHYSGTYPAARLAVGLYRGVQLAGVAVFSVSMNNDAVPAWTGLDDAQAGVELGRLVLLDDVPGNAESYFGARAFSAVRREKGVAAVLSYCDPVERRDAAGRLVKPGHCGTIYQALNGTYRGRTKPRTAYATAGGNPISERALSKIRQADQGIDYALRQLQSAGAPARSAHESGAAYLDRLFAEGALRRHRHPGNHVYTFPLTRAARAAGASRPAHEYPKAVG